MNNSEKDLSLLELFWIFLRLGCTSFGGPAAHIAYFHHEFVTKRSWYQEDDYLQIVALCQFLPGPASSQVGMAIGFNARSYLGSIVSFLGFTLPSACLMGLFAYLLLDNAALTHSYIFYGLKLIAVAVVLQAIFSMAKPILVDSTKIILCLLSASAALFFTGGLSQIVIIVAAGLASYAISRQKHSAPHSSQVTADGKTISAVLIISSVALFIFVPVLNVFSDNALLDVFDRFYRTGAMVFGGGHVVLPFLENELVASNIVSNDQFLYGYSLAQAIPGPLFTFASYLGVVMAENISPLTSSIAATLAIFLPGYLLVIGLLPYWQNLSTNHQLQRFLIGVNASVLGLLIAAFIDPVFSHTVNSLTDFCIFLVLFLCLFFLKISPLKLIIGVMAIALLLDFYYV